jgi:hypothetical protein
MHFFIFQASVARELERAIMRLHPMTTANRHRIKH